MSKHSSTLLHVAVIILLGGLFILSGCSGDDPAAPANVSGDSDPVVTPTDEELWESVLKMPDSWWGFERSGESIGVTQLPFPDSPQQLLENFRTAYETKDVVQYLLIMHPDFETVLQTETMDLFPDVGSTLDRMEEQAIHKHMFPGMPVTDPDGNFVPGVQDIDFEVFVPVGVWEDAPDGDYFPDSQMAPYEVQITLNRGPSYSTLRVEGLIRFYVMSREFEYQDGPRQFYQMVGQVDLTGGFKSSENAQWGTVKALYR
jgi:hypothetical protein